MPGSVRGRHSSGETSQEILLPAPNTSQDSFSSPHPKRVSQQSPGQTAFRSMGPLRTPVKSQYPRDSAQSHVEFILVASFDILKGATMEHQYPGEISSDEHMLAELMLPDQAHNRAQDWTIFFLHKDTSGDEEQSLGVSPQKLPRSNGKSRPESPNGRPRDSSGDTSSDDAEVKDEDDMEGPPLIYVLNLVSTKKDDTVARNAVCKAMAICTRHPFLHIYKPLLLLALDDYFKRPGPEVLASLYSAVNAMDLSLLPRLSILERTILQASSAKNFFLEKFQYMFEQRKADSLRLSAGSVTKPRPDSPLTPSGGLPRDTHDFESKILYSGILVPVKIPTAKFPETVGDFSLIKLISAFAVPHAQDPRPFSPIHPHLTTNGPNTHPIIVLINALLTQKRIIFVGHKTGAGEVAEAVLAACALASGGVLRGFTRHAFPYTELTKIDDLLKVPGFIAGVTNPTFANKPEWWDLLCDLSDGRMRISNHIRTAELTPTLSAWVATNPPQPQNMPHSHAQDNTGDAAFMEAVMRNINARVGESRIRAMWREWILRFTRQAAAFEELVYGSSSLSVGSPDLNSKVDADNDSHGLHGHGYVWPDDAARTRDLASSVHRIEGWRNTRSYFSLLGDTGHAMRSRPISGIDLQHQHDRLRTQKLSPETAAAIYLAFERVVQSTRDISQLLTVTSEAHGGLFYISMGLLHGRREVRHASVRLLDRIAGHEAGRLFWEGLGRFMKVAFERVVRDMESMAEEENGRDGNGNGDGEEYGNGNGASYDYADGDGEENIEIAADLFSSTTSLGQMSLADDE